MYTFEVKKALSNGKECTEITCFKSFLYNGEENQVVVARRIYGDAELTQEIKQEMEQDCEREIRKLNK